MGSNVASVALTSPGVASMCTFKLILLHVADRTERAQAVQVGWCACDQVSSGALTVRSQLGM
jgi:hypothetical protein